MVVAIFASDCSLTFALLAWLAMTTAAAITTMKSNLILSGCQPWLSLLVVSPDCQSGRPVQTLGMPPSFIQCGTPGVPLRTSRGSGGRVCRISECVHHTAENGTPAPTVDLMLDQRRRQWLTAMVGEAADRLPCLLIIPGKIQMVVTLRLSKMVQLTC